jgi:hypothetical protein
MFLEKVHRLMKVMTELGLFVLVWVIAGAVMFGIGTIAWDFIRSKNDEVKVEAKISDKTDGKSELTLKINQIEKLGSLWVAHIQEPKDSYRVDYHASKSIDRNLLLTPDNSSKAHILFDSYKNKISQFRGLPDYNNPKVLICTYIQNYNDSIDDDNAKLSLMLVSKDGAKQKVIVEGADRVLKAEMADESNVNFVYFKEGKLVSSMYSIKDFKSISSPAIFDLKDTSLKNSPLLMKQE